MVKLQFFYINVQYPPSPGADIRRGEEVGPMRTKADKGEGGSVLADILRMSFMDDP